MRSLVVLAFFGLVGCGAASDKVEEVTGENTASLHGTWHAEDGVEHPATITLDQRALSVSLVMELEGHSCLARSELEASFSTDGLETKADVAGMHLQLSGGSKLDQIVGNFEAIEHGPCQRGWVTFAR